jgi:uncharacterized protein YbjT (DUF2867 family)
MTSLPIVLVTGATGSTGLEVVQALSSSGAFQVLAGVRDLAKAESIPGLRLPRVKLVKLDSDSQSAAAAFASVDYVYLLTAPMQPSFAIWLEAIRKAGVKHVVYHSAVGAGIGSPVRQGAEHGEHEAALSQSSVPYTVLRPAFFHQNVEKFAVASITQYNMYGGSAGTGRFPSIDLRDVAAVAAAVFQAPQQHAGKTYELTGQLTTEQDIAAALTAALGRPISYAQWSVEEHRRNLESWGMSGWQLEDELVLNQWKREEKVAMSPDAARILGRQPITVQQYTKDRAELFKTKA